MCGALLPSSCCWSARDLLNLSADTRDTFPSANQFDLLVIGTLSPGPVLLLVLSYTDTFPLTEIELSICARIL